MTATSLPEVWLRGPLPGVPPVLMPAAHCLLQCREEIGATASALPAAQVWARPAGIASAGFHLRHIVGSLDRLLTYARGDQLTREQMAALRAEGDPGNPAEDGASLVAKTLAAIDSAVAVIGATPDADLF